MWVEAIVEASLLDSVQATLTVLGYATSQDEQATLIYWDAWLFERQVLGLELELGFEQGFGFALVLAAGETDTGHLASKNGTAAPEQEAGLGPELARGPGVWR